MNGWRLLRSLKIRREAVINGTSSSSTERKENVCRKKTGVFFWLVDGRCRVVTTGIILEIQRFQVPSIPMFFVRT